MTGRLRALWHDLYRPIAVLEILGAVFAIAWFGFAMLQALLRGNFSVWGVVFLGLYGFGLWAGLRLWRKEPGGVAMSIVFQALQLLRFTFPKHAFLFSSGLAGWLTVGSNGIGYDTAFRSAYQYSHTRSWGATVESGAWMLGVNLIAGLFLAYLISHLRHKERHPLEKPALALK